MAVNHSEVHSNKSTCDHCNKGFSSKGLVNLHAKPVHPVDMFVYTHCSKSFIYFKHIIDRCTVTTHQKPQIGIIVFDFPTSFSTGILELLQLLYPSPKLVVGNFYSFSILLLNPQLGASLGFLHSYPTGSWKLLQLSQACPSPRVGNFPMINKNRHRSFGKLFGQYGKYINQYLSLPTVMNFIRSETYLPVD